jgi:hypothetical protein
MPHINMWLEYPKLLILFLSPYVMLNAQPVCIIYFNVQLVRFIAYTPFSY